jgi:hypothetical protein
LLGGVKAEIKVKEMRRWEKLVYGIVFIIVAIRVRGVLVCVIL